MLFVTPEINTILDGKHESYVHLPVVETEATIGRFCKGLLITASLLGNSKKRPDFERLRGLDEVWVICIRKPKMFQIRLFGRFACSGVFVATNLYERGDLGTEQNYNSLAALVPNAWTDIVGELVPPMAATTVKEYLGGVVRDVDENE